MTNVPTLKTERLNLIPPKVKAWLDYLTFMVPKRPAFMGGPVFPRLPKHGELAFLSNHMRRDVGLPEYHEREPNLNLRY